MTVLPAPGSNVSDVAGVVMPYVFYKPWSTALIYFTFTCVEVSS